MKVEVLTFEGCPNAQSARELVERVVAESRVEAEIEDYDVAPDGSRFLVSTPLEKVRESPIRVLLDWTAELEKQR